MILSASCFYHFFLHDDVLGFFLASPCRRSIFFFRPGAFQQSPLFTSFSSSSSFFKGETSSKLWRKKGNMEEKEERNWSNMNWKKIVRNAANRIRFPLRFRFVQRRQKILTFFSYGKNWMQFLDSRWKDDVKKAFSHQTCCSCTHVSTRLGKTETCDSSHMIHPPSILLLAAEEGRGFLLCFQNECNGSEIGARERRRRKRL